MAIRAEQEGRLGFGNPSRAGGDGSDLAIRAERGWDCQIRQA
ncbi:hypothetical protein QUF72_06960 [Desulfobacterales bacterium HSG2]|nr:hypothetical protein [Desulfobacterales bacterium HSG2]